MQLVQSAPLLWTALLAIALTGGMQLTAAAPPILAPDTAAVGFNQTVVLDVLANDASDPTSVQILWQGIPSTFVNGNLAVTTCGDPPRDCISYTAPAAKPGETYLQSRWTYGVLPKANSQSIGVITVDIIAAPVSVNDDITVSPTQITQRQEINLDNLLDNDYDPNTDKVPNLLPLAIESASCELSTVCHIEGGTHIIFHLRGLEESFTYTIRNNMNVTSTTSALVRIAKRPDTSPDPYITATANATTVIDVLKNDESGLRITSVTQPAAGLGAVALVNCSSLQGAAATDSPDCLLYTAGIVNDKTQVVFFYNVISRTGGAAQEGVMLVIDGPAKPAVTDDLNITVPFSAARVIDVLKNDEPGLRISTFTQPPLGQGTVTRGLCSNLSNTTTSSVDCLLYTVGVLAAYTQVRFSYTAVSAAGGTAEAAVQLVIAALPVPRTDRLRLNFRRITSFYVLDNDEAVDRILNVSNVTPDSFQALVNFNDGQYLLEVIPPFTGPTKLTVSLRYTVNNDMYPDRPRSAAVRISFNAPPATCPQWLPRNRSTTAAACAGLPVRTCIPRTCSCRCNSITAWLGYSCRYLTACKAPKG